MKATCCRCKEEFELADEHDKQFLKPVEAGEQTVTCLVCVKASADLAHKTARETKKSKDTPWHLEGVYDNEIAPLMQQIIDICKREDMPMIASFAYENDVGGEGIGFATTQLGSFQPDQIREAGHALWVSDISTMTTIATKEN